MGFVFGFGFGLANLVEDVVEALVRVVDHVPVELVLDQGADGEHTRALHTHRDGAAVPEDRYGEVWGGVGRCGEMRGDAAVEGGGGRRVRRRVQTDGVLLS